MASPALESASSQLTVDDLRQMNYEELDRLYRSAKRPAALSDLNGDAKGAMLAWRSPASGPLASLLKSLGMTRSFPWKGKSFQSEDASEGRGINRITLLKNMRWFPFGTRFDASFLDGQPTFVLDYSGRGNPPLINTIVDEVREVAPGLYMGPAALKIGNRPRPILFFAVSFR